MTRGAAFGPPFFISFISQRASDMRFTITIGTSIHEYAEEFATATDALGPDADHDGLGPTKNLSLERGRAAVFSRRTQGVG
jgi:hypothetical protein